jgi:hypothetical protein
MKKSVFLLIILLSFVYHNADAQVQKGNGIIKKEGRKIDKFDKIIAHGNFNLILTNSDIDSIYIETDQNLLEFFQTQLKNNTLTITMLANIKKSTKLDVLIPASSIKEIFLLGDLTLKTNTTIHLEDLYIFSGGESKINVDLFVTNLDLLMTDGTLATFKGFCKNFNFKAHDETELDAFGFQVEHCNATITGLSESEIWVKKDINILSTGGSNLRYAGSPKVKKITSSFGFIAKSQNRTR